MVSRRYLLIAILPLVGCTSWAWAQQPDPRVNPPAAPQRPLPTGESSAKGSEAASAPEQTPDTSALSGAELFTLGRLGKTRSYTFVGFQALEAADTNVAVTSTKRTITSATSLLGHIGLQRVRGRYQFLADYQGGGTLYSPRSDLNTSMHDFGLSQRIAWRRSTLVLRDQLSYLPESSFGFVGGGGTSTITQDLNPLVLPSQSILTTRTQRISNTAVAELQHVLNRKSSVSASASYGLLQFLHSPGFANNRNAIFLLGYERTLSARNILAFNYGFSWFGFGQGRARIYDHMLHVAYGRRVTGRLALELSAGPELYLFRNPQFRNTSSTRVNWGMESALRYRWPRTNLRITQASYLNGGAGVVQGAQTHEVRLAADRELSRVWRGTLDLGYARNFSFPETTTGLTRLKFDTLFAGVDLGRQLGRHMAVSLAYRALRQHALSGCTSSTVGLVTTCSNLPVRHHVSFGLEWHNRPIALD